MASHYEVAFGIQSAAAPPHVAESGAPAFKVVAELAAAADIPIAADPGPSQDPNTTVVGGLAKPEILKSEELKPMDTPLGKPVEVMVEARQQVDAGNRDVFAALPSGTPRHISVALEIPERNGHIPQFRLVFRGRWKDETGIAVERHAEAALIIDQANLASHVECRVMTEGDDFLTEDSPAAAAERLHERLLSGSTMRLVFYMAGPKYAYNVFVHEPAFGPYKETMALIRDIAAQPCKITLLSNKLGIKASIIRVLTLMNAAKRSNPLHKFFMPGQRTPIHEGRIAFSEKRPRYLHSGTTNFRNMNEALVLEGCSEIDNKKIEDARFKEYRKEIEGDEAGDYIDNRQFDRQMRSLDALQEAIDEEKAHHQLGESFTEHLYLCNDFTALPLVSIYANQRDSSIKRARTLATRFLPPAQVLAFDAARKALAQNLFLMGPPYSDKAKLAMFMTLPYLLTSRRQTAVNMTGPVSVTSRDVEMPPVQPDNVDSVSANLANIDLIAKGTATLRHQIILVSNTNDEVDKRASEAKSFFTRHLRDEVKVARLFYSNTDKKVLYMAGIARQGTESDRYQMKNGTRSEAADVFERLAGRFTGLNPFFRADDKRLKPGMVEFSLGYHMAQRAGVGEGQPSDEGLRDPQYAEFRRLYEVWIARRGFNNAQRARWNELRAQLYIDTLKSMDVLCMTAAQLSDPQVYLNARAAVIVINEATGILPADTRAIFAFWNACPERIWLGDPTQKRPRMSGPKSQNGFADQGELPIVTRWLKAGFPVFSVEAA